MARRKAYSGSQAPLGSSPRIGKPRARRPIYERAPARRSQRLLQLSQASVPTGENGKNDIDVPGKNLVLGEGVLTPVCSQQPSNSIPQDGLPSKSSSEHTQDDCFHNHRPAKRRKVSQEEAQRLPSHNTEAWLQNNAEHPPDPPSPVKAIPESPPTGVFIRMPPKRSYGVESTTLTSGPNQAAYTRNLETYNVFCERYDAPQLLVDEARRIVLEHRPVELDDTKVEEIVRLSRLSRSNTEDAIIDVLDFELFPFRKKTPFPLVRSRNSQWLDALDLERAARVDQPPLLTLPKPDMAFSIDLTDGLTDRQQRAAGRFKQNGMAHTVPDRRGGWLPCLTMEFKAAATGGTRYVGTDQANLAGSVMLHTFHQLYSHAHPGEDLLAEPTPRFFSIVLDHEIVAFNVHWIGRRGTELTYNLEQIEMFRLRYPDDVKHAYRAGQNIIDWAVKTHVPWVAGLLDRYEDRVESGEAAPEEPPPPEPSGVEAMGPPPPPQWGFKRRSSARGRGASLAGSSAGRARSESRASVASRESAPVEDPGPAGQDDARESDEGPSQQRMRRDSPDRELSGSLTSDVSKQMSQL